jgi:hypothetical protein
MTNDDKTKDKYLIGETCGSEYGREEASYAIVQISEASAKNILSWMRKFEKGGVLEGAAYVQFFDYSATFLMMLDKVYPSYDESGIVIADFSELLTHVYDLSYEGDDGPVVRTELNMMSISDDRVRWNACIKHTDADVESPALTREQIEEMIADFAKEAT